MSESVPRAGRSNDLSAGARAPSGDATASAGRLGCRTRNSENQGPTAGPWPCCGRCLQHSSSASPPQALRGRLEPETTAGRGPPRLDELVRETVVAEAGASPASPPATLAQVQAWLAPLATPAPLATSALQARQTPAPARCLQSDLDAEI